MKDKNIFSIDELNSSIFHLIFAAKCVCDLQLPDEWAKSGSCRADPAAGQHGAGLDKSQGISDGVSMETFYFRGWRFVDDHGSVRSLLCGISSKRNWSTFSSRGTITVSVCTLRMRVLNLTWVQTPMIQTKMWSCILLCCISDLQPHVLTGFCWPRWLLNRNLFEK